jgi:hypothetical protein
MSITAAIAVDTGVAADQSPANAQTVPHAGDLKQESDNLESIVVTGTIIPQ